MKKTIFLFLIMLMSIKTFAQELTYGANNSYRITTPSGYIDIGPQNPDWAHIYTNRSKFIFNKPVYSWNGVFSAYNTANLYLQTNAQTRLTILKSNGFVGIGKTNPTEMLDVNGRIRSNYLRLNATSSAEGGELRLDGPSGKNPWIVDNYNGEFRLHHSGSTFVRMKSDGKMGIGTLTPQARLDINHTGTLGGTFTESNAYLKITSGSSSLLMDNNEIYTNNALAIGSAYQHDIFFRNVNTAGYQDLMTIKSSGKVGVGTNSPDEKLTVAGNINVGGSGNGGIKVRHVDGKNNTSTSYGPLYLNYSTTSPVYVGRISNKSNLLVQGNVGIGTSSPTEALEVNGTIRSKEVKVEAAPWPDYVFEADYNLKSLSSVADFISKNGHLPNVPSAAVVEANGVALGEMNAKLLEKIEELTLYIIDQNKRIEQLESKTSKL